MFHACPLFWKVVSCLKDKNLISYVKPGGFGRTLNSSVRSCEGAAVNGCREEEVTRLVINLAGRCTRSPRRTVRQPSADALASLLCLVIFITKMEHKDIYGSLFPPLNIKIK